jgi:hypothetical protein
MSKAFWEGFFEGVWKASVILNPFIILWLSYMLVFHPYEQCKRMYETPEDISECVWIKENP